MKLPPPFTTLRHPKPQPGVTSMSSITLTLTDTPDGVAIHSTFKPTVGHHCTPAQGYSLEVVNRCHKQWGQITRHSDGVDIDAVHLHREPAALPDSVPGNF